MAETGTRTSGENPPWLVHPALWPSLWTLSEDSAGGDDSVARWRRVYDSMYKHPGGPFGEDFTGWISPVNGRPIPHDQMRRWRDETVARIRRLGGCKILEIGAGSGLLLAELGPHYESYWATDLSPVVVERLRTQVAQAGFADRTVLRCQPADDLSGLPIGEFDTVVLNSVIQDFPSARYLLDVIDGVAGLLAPGGAIHIGDVRRLELQRALRVSVRLGRLSGAVWPDRLDCGARDELVRRLRDLVDEDVAVEEELLIDPRLFATMPGHLPNCTGVEVRLKGGPDHNEVTSYRYDVTLHTRPDVVDVSSVPSWDWGSDVADVAALVDRLRLRRPPSVRVRGVPNARVTGAVAAAAALAGGGSLTQVRAALVTDDVCPAGLERVVRESGYRCAATWSTRNLDLMDVVLLPDTTPLPRLAGLYVPDECPSGPWPNDGWTNRPTRQ